MPTDRHERSAPKGAEGDPVQIAQALGAIARRLVPSGAPLAHEERDHARRPAISRHDPGTMVNMAL